MYSNLKTLNIIEDSERSILQRFCVAVHNQDVYTQLDMAGGAGLLASGFSDASTKEHSTCPHCGKEI